MQARLSTPLPSLRHTARVFAHLARWPRPCWKWLLGCSQTGLLDIRRRRRLPVGLFQSADDTVLESRGTHAKKRHISGGFCWIHCSDPSNARAEAHRSTRAAAAAGPTPVALISNVGIIGPTSAKETLTAKTQWRICIAIQYDNIISGSFGGLFWL